MQRGLAGPGGGEARKLNTPSLVPRLFVPAGSIVGGRLTLRGTDAARAVARGVQPEGELIALDNSGWETVVRVEGCSADLCTGVVSGRRLSPEPRTKISLYHALLHPADYRRLIIEGTALGVVAFVPLVSDRCELRRLDYGVTAEPANHWTVVARDAAEIHGRGRCPVLAPPMLYDQALDACQVSSLALLLCPGGKPLAKTLEGRPFSVDVLCPPPSGFSEAEVRRAQSRGLVLTDWPRAGIDPVAPGLAVVRAILSLTES